MQYFRKISLIAALAVFLFGETQTVQAQAVSTCPRSLGEQYLDINNVRARILNTGGLFYRGEPHVYEVPKGSGSNAIFASGIWLAGQVGGQLRAAAARYGNNEYWAGPLDDNGNPPVDCVVYDRVYKVSRDNVADYEATGSAIPDLADWPTGLGAPTVDADGNKINLLDQPLASRVGRTIDLGAGERPDILGDGMVWAVMNDRGNVHNSTDAPPIGIEVHMTAFAFNTAGALGDATFYKYNLFYKGDVPLTETYMGIFSDPDLGDFDDDLVGSDTTLGMGFVYNADNEDGGGEGYGTPPPAAGYDFFQGPIIPSPGDTAQVSGVKIPDFKNRKMDTFAFYNNGGGVTEDPTTGPHYYGYMKGEWKDGKRFTFGGNGRDFSEEPTNFMFPGDPAIGEYWSERNSDNQGTAIEPGDRRFVLSTGPFTINPGDQQEIIFGLVFAKGDDNFDSVNALRDADALAQAAFDVNFQLPQPPNAPDVHVTAMDQQVIIEWTNRADRSNNYLEAYSAEDPFAPFDNPNYDFEGYKVYQFSEAADQVGQVIATYDIVNEVTEVIDGAPFKPTSVVASGTDSGIQTWHSITSLTNYKTYYFGVQAYAYNEPSFPKIYPSPIARVEVTPQPSSLNVSDLARDLAISAAEADFEGVPQSNAGAGQVFVDIVNPAALIADATYKVNFYELEGAGKRASLGSSDMNEADMKFAMDDISVGKRAAAITYDIVREDPTGIHVVFDGSATGEPAPQRANVAVVDGLQFSVLGPPPRIDGFAAVANASGPLDPYDMAAFAFNSSGFPQLEETGLVPPGTHPNSDRPTSGYQQTNGSTWGWHTGGGGRTSFATYINRTLEGRGHTVADDLGANNFEFRFLQSCIDVPGSCMGWRRFEDDAPMNIPFQIWMVGTGDDPSDDVRLLPAILDTGGSTNVLEEFDIGSDHDISGGDNDPYTDWVYWYWPTDASPGQAGYDAFVAGTPSNGNANLGAEIMGRTVLVNWNGGTDPGPYDADLPESGSIFRLITSAPAQAGDSFVVETSEYATSEKTAEQKEDELALIGIVPNPYKGSSAYERSQLIDEVRFTGMPNEETVLRVFTLNGSLIKTLFKPEGVRNQAWNMTTDNNLPIASGMYLIHVDVKDVGSKVIKFAAIKKRVQLNTF